MVRALRIWQFQTPAEVKNLKKKACEVPFVSKGILTLEKSSHKIHITHVSKIYSSGNPSSLTEESDYA